jgi:hypothetical protein
VQFDWLKIWKAGAPVLLKKLTVLQILQINLQNSLQNSVNGLG